ncbi:MAG: hypothetical protein LC664_00635 [Flavobacteriales bacterium]|nr:hypothetical protein [Flavobacteriales bacterium]
MKNPCICMTATIEPNTVLVTRSDVNERLNDYKKAVRFYLDKTHLPVYFLENSSFDIDGDNDFKQFLERPNFKVLRFPTHTDQTRGKGFQEFYTIDRFVAGHMKEDFLVKVTGRYIVRNFSSLVSQLSADVNIDLHRKMKVAITGFFGVSKSTYSEHFAGLYTRANDGEGRYIEHVLYDYITGTDLINRTALLPENPEYRGVSGSYGQSLHRNKYKMMVRGVERKLSRSLGIKKFLIEY